MSKSFWKTDWFIGVVVSVVVLFAGGGELLQSLERKAYDMGVLASSRAPSDRIAVIAIDDESIANIGRWPWSREVHARMLTRPPARPPHFSSRRPARRAPSLLRSTNSANSS